MVAMYAKDDKTLKATLTSKPGMKMTVLSAMEDEVECDWEEDLILAEGGGGACPVLSFEAEGSWCLRSGGFLLMEPGLPAPPPDDMSYITPEKLRSFFRRLKRSEKRSH